MKTMKVALLYENSNDLALEEVNIPELNEGEALIKVKSCGICHSDLNIIDGIIKPPKYPHILGHEIAGIIEDYKHINSEEKMFVENIFQETEGRVLVYFYITCGHCSYCLRGEDNLCLYFKRIGFEEWGGYAEYIKVPIKNLIPLPNQLDFNAAILVDAGATTYRALRKTSPLPGSIIAIIGIGGLGGMAIQIAKAFGAQVLAIDILDEKLTYAKKLGADRILNFKDIRYKDINDVRNVLKKNLNINYVNAVIDTVGSNDTVSLGMCMVGRGGRIILLGYGKEKSLNILPIKIIYDEIVFEGSRGASKWEVYEILQLAKKNLIVPNVTNEYKLENVNVAINDFRAGKILGRSIIKFD
jgi:propanol-preferring alcohol dehydrogenase